MAAGWTYIWLLLFCALMSEATIGGKRYQKRDETAGQPRYRPAFNTSLQGRPFKSGTQHLASLGLPPKRYTKLQRDFIRDFVFVTAASSAHFQESLDGLGSMQERVINRKIFYYDLGLSDTQAAQLQWHGGGGAASRVVCGVNYRKFDFSRYPEHVKNLDLYSWKFLIIKEILEEFQGVYWMDTSVRLSSSYFMHVLEPKVKASGGIMLFTKPDPAHSNYAVTAQGLYDYFPTDTEAQKRLEQFDGGNLLVYNTEGVYENVLKWMYLCVLEPQCISPATGVGSGSNRCQFKEDRFRESADCHHHDQSTLNLLLSNWFRFKPKSYGFTEKSISKVIRRASDLYKLRWCDPISVDRHDEL